MTTRTRLFTASVLAVAALTSAAVATAAVYGPGVPTRAQYVSRAEKVCRKTDKQMTALTKAAGKAAKAGDAKTAGKKFGQVVGAFGKGVGRLKKLPKPTADRGTLTKWLRSLAVDVKLLRSEAKAYQAGDGAKLSRAVKAAKEHGAKTNAIVRRFGFHSCLVNR